MIVVLSICVAIIIVRQRRKKSGFSMESAKKKIEQHRANEIAMQTTSSYSANASGSEK